MLPCTDCGKPNSCSAWSIRCGPVSNHKPLPGRSARASGRGLPGGSGRNATRSVSPRRGCLAQSSDGSEIVAVPAAVMEDGEQTLFLLRRAISSRASCISRVKGLSTTTCLPAFSARRASGACVALGEAMTTCQRPDAGPLLPGGDHRDVRQIAFDLLFIAGSDEREFSPGTERISGAWKVLPTNP